jgi:hypothetical protein
MRRIARGEKVVLAAILPLGGSLACATEQTQDGLANAAEASRTVPSGTSLVFSVDERVSTTTHARGDVFSATLRHRVTGDDGSEAIPEGVPSQWIVAEAVTYRGETVLAIRVESIRVDGTWLPVKGDVTEAFLRTTNGARVAVGTAAGELLREGVADGTELGGFVTLTTRGAGASIPAGSTITVQLTEPLEV